MEDWQYKYTYDANGNLIQKIPKDVSKNAYVYSYSSKNQLVQVQVLENPLGQVLKQVNYSYDVLGRRMQKTVWDRENQTDPKKTFTRRYVYDGDNILAEYDGNNSLLARYTHSPLMPDDVLSVEISSTGVTAGLAKNSGKFYYLKDAIGTVTDVADVNGSIVQRYDYESFGKVRSVKDDSGVDIGLFPVINTSFMFTGREWDAEAGLYYYRARYYDPNIGRFLQKDSDPGRIFDPVTAINKYTYVGNNPVTRIDPSGKNWLGDLLVGIVAFTAAVFAGPFVAAALLGTGAGAISFAAVSVVAGAAVGGVVGGLANTAIGNGTFEAGFRIGAMAGALGGLAGGLSLYGIRGKLLDIANESVYQGSFKAITHNVFPFESHSALLATLGMAGFINDQISKSCEEGESYDWKTNSCKASYIEVPIPIPGN